MLTESEVRAIKAVRYLRKLTDGRGFYLLVTPTGGRYWRFAYRYAQTGKTLAAMSISGSKVRASENRDVGWTADDPHLSGNYLPVAREFDVADLRSFPDAFLRT